MQADPHVKGLRYKTWPYYPQWIEIFGKDRAIEKDDNFISKPIDVHLNIVTRGKKWKTVDTDINMLVESLGDFMKFSKVALTEFSSGGDKGSVSSNENMQLNVIMKGIDGLKVSDKLKVCDELVQNSKRLEFFLTLPTEEHEEYVWMLLDGSLYDLITMVRTTC
ncbi:hypothetical protein ACS0TY_027668 [Phlomoides rotata]